MGVEPTNALRASRFSKPFPWASRASLQTEEPAARSSPRRAAANDSGAAGAPFPLPLQGSNLDFPDPESGVLPVTPRGIQCPFPVTGSISPRAGESGRRGSNPRPSAWEADALPTELLPHILRYEPEPSHRARAACEELSYSPIFFGEHRSPSHLRDPDLRGSNYNPTGRSLPEPPVRFELTTARLRIECSTPELRWRPGPPRPSSWSRGESNP